MRKEVFKNRLRDLLDEKGMRQVDLLNLCAARDPDVVWNKSDLSQYLHGVASPGREKLAVLSSVFDVNPRWLAGDIDAPRDPFDATLLALDIVVLHEQFVVRVVCEDYDPAVIEYSQEDWEQIRQRRDVSSVVGALTGGQSSLVSRRASRVARLYDKADRRDQSLVDAVLKTYEDQVPKEADKPKVVPLPKPKVKKRSDGFGEVITFEDQLPAAGLATYFDAPRSHVEQYPIELIPPGTSFAVPISGDSMEPTYHNGATVFVQSTPRVENGDVGLFSLNGAPFIKQLVVDDTRHEVRLHSLNERYEDIAVREFDDLRTFGKVLGSYSIK